MKRKNKKKKTVNKKKPVSFAFAHPVYVMPFMCVLPYAMLCLLNTR